MQSLESAPKKPYVKPKLTFYGSVRNLTGGSGLLTRDGLALKGELIGSVRFK